MNVIPWASNWGQLPICPILGCNSNDWQAQERQLLNGLLSCSLRNTWVSCQRHDNDSIRGLFIMYVILWASNWGQLPICPILGCNSNYWQAQERQLLNRLLSCRLRSTWVSCHRHEKDSITRHFIMIVNPWAANWGQLPICPILGRDSNDWQAQEIQLLNGFLSCRLRNTWVSCQVYDNDSLTGLFIMNVIPWASNWGQLPICPILGCNSNYWQAQERRLLNGLLSCRLRNTWVSCQRHDNDSITGYFIMNVNPWAANWGQLPICPILGRNRNIWQAQEMQLLKGFLSCRLRNTWVSCQRHDNDSITRLFIMNMIPWTANWGQLSICPILSAIASIGQHRGTGATAAQRVFAVHTEKCLSVLSGAWQWFHNWALSCRLRNTLVSCHRHDNASMTWLFIMNMIPWTANWGQLPICPILGRNSNYWQAQECQLLNRLLSCRLRNTWVSCQRQDNNCITGLYIMNERPWASSWGQLPICPILGCNSNYWQAQECQLLNGLLSCRLRNSWVSCQRHDNDSITGLFIMNEIPWASSWGQRPICQILGCNCNYWQAHRSYSCQTDFCHADWEMPECLVRSMTMIL